MRKIISFLIVFIPLFTVASTDQDPLEGLNRSVFWVNEGLDKILLKPVAKGYQWATPQFIDDGVTHFFNNLSEVKTVPNAVLQFKLKKAGTSSMRLMINSTLGVAGFFDVATKMGLKSSKEDFGQTLGHWGVPSGPYLMLPLFGPSNLRDAASALPEFWVHQRWLNPANFLAKDYRLPVNLSLTVINTIDTRADLLAIESMLTGDRYVALRELSIQLREFNVKDGVVEDTFLDISDDDGEFIEEEDLFLDF